MKIDMVALAQKLAGAGQDDKMTEELALQAAEQAENFQGTPSEFLKTVIDGVKAANPGFKFNSSGGYQIAQKALKELISGESSQSPPTKTNSTPAKAVVKVALNDKMAAYGGQFYDPETKTWISGTKAEPQEVPLTIFVQQKIGNGELIEIRD